jgi:hypothetical protein
MFKLKLPDGCTTPVTSDEYFAAKYDYLRSGKVKWEWRPDGTERPVLSRAALAFARSQRLMTHMLQVHKWNSEETARLYGLAWGHRRTLNELMRLVDEGGLSPEQACSIKTAITIYESFRDKYLNWLHVDILRDRLIKAVGSFSRPGERAA